jgi:hypothetical protein
MTLFDYFIHKKKTLKFIWHHFGIQNSLWVENNFDSIVRWKRLVKINIHRVYNLQFFDNHRASCLWFIENYKK